MKIASRLDKIEMSGIRKMFDLAGKNAIHLGLGEPDFQPPQNVMNALKTAVAEGHNKYESTTGIVDLRTAIAESSSKYKKGLNAENVIVTTGGTEALMCTQLSFFEKGDEVLIPDPGFVLYSPQLKIAGAKPVLYPLHHENDFVPKEDDLKNLITPKTKAIITNSPSNPTGGMFKKEDVKMILDLAMDHNLLIISDEVYDQIVYDGKHYSFLGDYENVIHINSFSKTYSMTGWRIGYIISSTDIIKNLAIMHYHIVACPSTPIQYAALTAIKGPQDYVAKMVKEFKLRRDLIVKELNSIEGFHCAMPKGAFYAFPMFDYKLKSSELAIKLAQNNLICSPGSAFGPRGEGHLRFSYANSQDNIKKGIEIIKKVSETL